MKGERTLERRTGVIRDSLYLEHRPSEYHPESPKRLEILYRMLEEADVLGTFRDVSPRPCEREDLERVHESRYIDLVASTEGKSRVSLDPDTQTSARSYEAALYAVGGCLKAIDLIFSGDLDNAFAMIRPPGHHAETARAMGFCLFNNVAIAARYAQAKFGVNRVMIVDWDLHHGNGTQRTFYQDPTVLYASTHQYPYYPGTGAFQEVGDGEGAGFTVNVPLFPGHGDAEYVEIYRRVVSQIGKAFRPELVIVSAGFDIFEGDPLGGMAVTPNGFALLARVLMDLADEVCEGKLLVALEGGYDLQGLHNAAKAVLQELTGQNTISTDLEQAGRTGRARADSLIREFLVAQGERWRDAVQ
jgi:acetoin utilization deacetylase AcuC-like enzyme